MTVVAEDTKITKVNQTITFGPLSNKMPGDAPFSVSATASSNLAVSFTATGSCTYTASGSIVTITGEGTCTITAAQAGDSTYAAATDVSQTFSIAKSPQTLTFSPPASATLGSGPLTLSATGGTSGNAVTFASTTLNVCTVSGTTLTIVSVGTCTVTANQEGNANYSPYASKLK